MKKIFIITGPTGAGKTPLAVEVAKRINGEIISADSCQIYKRLDIGTAKPAPALLSSIKHYLVNFLEPVLSYSVFQFVSDCKTAVEEIEGKGKIPIVVGGSIFYLKVLYDGIAEGIPQEEGIHEKIQNLREKEGLEYLYQELKKVDPSVAEKIKPQDTQRISRALEVYYGTGRKLSDWWREGNHQGILRGKIGFCLTLPRSELYGRINRRVEQMIAAGWVDEVRGLLNEKKAGEWAAFNAVGYREIIDYLKGHNDLPHTIEAIQKRTRHYAKRQLTFLRRIKDLEWLDIYQLGFEETVNAVSKRILSESQSL